MMQVDAEVNCPVMSRRNWFLYVAYFLLFYILYFILFISSLSTLVSVNVKNSSIRVYCLDEGKKGHKCTHFSFLFWGFLVTISYFCFIKMPSFFLTSDGDTTCTSEQFQCVESLHICISLSWKCDFDHDCPDGSDETNCTCKSSAGCTS